MAVSSVTLPDGTTVRFGEPVKESAENIVEQL